MQWTQLSYKHHHTCNVTIMGCSLCSLHPRYTFTHSQPSHIAIMCLTLLLPCNYQPNSLAIKTIHQHFGCQIPDPLLGSLISSPRPRKHQKGPGEYQHPVLFSLSLESVERYYSTDCGKQLHKGWRSSPLHHKSIIPSTWFSNVIAMCPNWFTLPLLCAVRSLQWIVNIAFKHVSKD